MKLVELTHPSLATPEVPALTVKSWFIDGVAPLVPDPFTAGLPTSAKEFLTQLPTDTLTCWVKENSGLVGCGRVCRLRARGAGRFGVLARLWEAVVSRAEVVDHVSLPGSGLVGFTTIAFADDSAADSVIDVPQFILGRRDGRVWLTAIHVTGQEPECLVLNDSPLQAPLNPQVSAGQVTPERFVATVGDATQLMEAGRARKLVLARDLVVETGNDVDVRALTGGLNQAYPSTWTFCVAGMVGATPELLIEVAGGAVQSRVLAGTYRVDRDPVAELCAARAQLGGAKDSAEHRYAVESLAEALGPLCSDLRVDDEPHILTLSNVIHLASDAHGTLKGASSLLEVAAAVHPTAAVGGVPREAAAELIGGLEQADRGRYAGPVGWINAAGDGQLGIALRCGQLEERNRIRVWAGCGIMPDSDAQAELAETRAKFAPMLSALGLAAHIPNV